MNAREAFKFGFISRCIEDGLTSPAAIHDRLTKTAVLSLSDVTAVPKGIWGGIKDIGKAGLGVGALGIVAPALLGAAGGTLAAKMTDVDDRDVDELKNQEVIEEYRRQAERLRRAGEIRKRTAALESRRPRYYGV